jgi:hypothetical protein
MPEFTLDVYGKEYVIDAPDQKSAVDAALGHYQSTYGQAQPFTAGPSPYAENVGMLEKPIEFQGRKPQEVGATLDNTPPPKELAADILKVVSPQAPSVSETEVQAIYGTMQNSASIRDYFNQQVANGSINPSSEFDTEKTPVLAGLWNQYKSEMEDIGGAFKQGAKGALGPTIGAYAGEALGSVPLVGGAFGALTGAALGYEQAGLPGAIGGAGLLAATGATPGIGTVQTALIGGYLGGKLQEAIVPMTTEERAKASFAEANRASRYAKLTGEVAPLFVTWGKVGAVKAIAGGVIGGGIEAVRQATGPGKMDFEKIAERAIQGAVGSQSKGIPDTFKSQVLRKELAAIKQRNQVMGQFTSDPEAAVAAIEATQIYAQGGFKPQLGEASGQKKLMNLQRVLTAKEDALQERDQKNLQAIARQLNESMSAVGAPPEEISRRFDAARREYMLGKRAATRQSTQQAAAEASTMMNSANDAAQELLANGEQEAGRILTEGITKADTIMQGAKNGLMSAEQAANSAHDELQKAFNALSSYRDMAGREAKRAVRSEVTKDALVNENERLTNKFNEAYSNEEITKAETSVNNMLNAAKAFQDNQKKIGTGGSSVVNAIVDSYKKKKTDSLNTLKERRTAIGGEIGEAIVAGNRPKAAALTGVKKAIERDMESAEKGNQILKQLNKKFFEYCEIFRDGVMGQVLRADNPIPNSQTIDQFFGSKESLQQLRAAIQSGEGSPTAVKAVTDSMIERMSSELEMNPTPEAITEWMSKSRPGEATRADWTTIFPELTPLMKSLTGGVQVATKQVEAAAITVQQAQSAMKMAESTAKDITAQADDLAVQLLKDAQGQGEQAVKEAKVNSKEIRDNAAAQAKALNKDAKQKLDASIAMKFIGTDPVAAVSPLFDEANAGAVRNARELMKLAAKDSSGKTVEAVKNAVRQNIDARTRLSKVVTMGGPSNEITKRDLAVSLSQTLDLVTNKKNAEVIDTVFGKGSKELEKIKLAQRQVELMSRRLQATPGESVTQFANAVSQKVEKELEDSVLGVIERVVSGVEPGKGKLVTSTMALARKLWTGDTKERVQELLTDVMLDPDIGVLAIKKITPENLPKVNELIRSYLVPPSQPFVSPQQESK